MAFSMLRFDMRVAAESPATPRDTWAAALDMCAWADELGLDTITLSEHHGVEDGHLSSPLTLAGAILGRTQRIPVNVCALLAPLYDPVRLAEDIATLDLIGGGRFSVVAGLGYREIEYHACSKEFRRRGKLLDECLDVLLKAWTGEPFEYRGETIRVTPRPHSRPHPPILVGGSTAAAAKRAARFGLPFSPPLSDPALNTLYLDECKANGVTHPFIADPGEPWMLYVASDPDQGWKDIGPYWWNDARQYQSWQRNDQRSYQHSGARDLDELRGEGKYRVLTPEQCLELADELGERAHFNHYPMGGGAPPEVGWKSLELFASEVWPHLR